MPRPSAGPVATRLDREREGPGAVERALLYLLPHLLVKLQGNQACHLDLQFPGLRQVADLHLAIRFALAAATTLR